MRERKLEVRYVPIDQLREWEKNPRKNDKAAEKLARLIEQYGFVNPVIATPDNVVRAGHTRIKAARRLGLKEVPVIYVDFSSEKEAEAFSLADNKSHEWATWDFQALEEIVTNLIDAGVDQELLGFDEKELDRILRSFDLEEVAEIDEVAATDGVPKGGRVMVCPNCGYVIHYGGGGGGEGEN